MSDQIRFKDPQQEWKLINAWFVKQVNFQALFEPRELVKPDGTGQDAEKEALAADDACIHAKEEKMKGKNWVSRGRGRGRGCRDGEGGTENRKGRLMLKKKKLRHFEKEWVPELLPCFGDPTSPHKLD